MEGSRRGMAAWLAATLVACALALTASGCGDDDSSAVGPAAVPTGDPVETFAPVIEVAMDEPWGPVGARWFIDHSLFGFGGCGGGTIAVGRSRPDLRDAVINWIFPAGLGRRPRNYFRNFLDAKCEPDFDRRLYADQLTRPHDPGQRLEGLPADQGFYLDLFDDQRSGIPVGDDMAAPIYAERIDEGDSRIRLTYWALFPMHGTPGRAGAHEGDWERVDVLLSVDGDRYEPEAVQVRRGDRLIERPWSATQAFITHPIVFARRATHTMTIAKVGTSCAKCFSWRGFDTVEPARKQPWYGFGGAWGEVGETSATTGPLGPHGYWPTAEDKNAELAAD